MEISEKKEATMFDEVKTDLSLEEIRDFLETRKDERFEIGSKTE